MGATRVSNGEQTRLYFPDVSMRSIQAIAPLCCAATFDSTRVENYGKMVSTTIFTKNLVSAGFRWSPDYDSRWRSRSIEKLFSAAGIGARSCQRLAVARG